MLKKNIIKHLQKKSDNGDTLAGPPTTNVTRSQITPAERAIQTELQPVSWFSVAD